MAFVLIIGAKSDIAKALAAGYAQKGYDLYLAGRQINSLADFARDLRIRTGRTILLQELDVRNFSAHEAYYSSLAPKPFGVIACAGFMADQALAQQSWATCLNTIQVNYTGMVSLLNIVADDFEAQHEGFIIGISSVAGDRGRKTNYIYGSAKAGFTAYLSGLRNRLHGKHVNVLTVKPGFVKTDMTKSMALPPALTALPEQAAKDIIRAQVKGKPGVYTLWMWRYIMLIIRHIPEFIFKRMSL